MTFAHNQIMSPKYVDKLETLHFDKINYNSSHIILLHSLIPRYLCHLQKSLLYPGGRKNKKNLKARLSIFETLKDTCICMQLNIR